MGSLATLAATEATVAAEEVQEYCDDDDDDDDASDQVPFPTANTSNTKMEKKEKRKPSQRKQDGSTPAPSQSRKKRRSSRDAAAEDDSEDGGDEHEEEEGDDDDEEEEDGTESSRSSSSDKDSDSAVEDDDDDYGDDEGNERERPDSTAFGRAFRKIMKKKVPETSFTEAMGPMLCAHKNLVTMKLEEMVALKESKTERKREKQAIREKGHTTITVYPAAKDRELIKLATRGVVKLFNAVSKAQSVQAAAKVSKEAETKEVAKRSKSAFLATLQGDNAIASEAEKKTEGLNKGTEQQPGWSALQDSFMLGKSKLKDWDKKQDGDGDMEDLESTDDDSQ